MTTELDEPGSYGRIARDPLRIVEAAEASPDIQSIRDWANTRAVPAD